MITIKFPPPLLPSDDSPKYSASDMVRDAVMILPFWRDGADLVKIDAFLEITDALEASPESPKVSKEARQFLREAMEMKMPNGQFGQLTNHRQNKFYMQVFRAVLVAEQDAK